MHVTTSQQPAPNLPLHSSAQTPLLSFTSSHFSAIRTEHNPTHGLYEQHVAGNTSSVAPPKALTPAGSNRTKGEHTAVLGSAVL